MRRAAFAFLILADCAEPPRPPQPSRPGVALFEFEGEFDLATGRLSFETPRATRALTALPVANDGIPNSGPPGTLELVTTSVGEGPASCAGFADSFCGNVRMRSFFNFVLDDVFVEITSITPAIGREALNSVSPVPPAAAGLSTTFGLFDYAPIPAQGSRERLWVFGNPDGTSFRFSGRVWGDGLRFSTTRVLAADTFIRVPVLMGPGPDGRIYLTQQNGLVRVVTDVNSTTSVWLNISSTVVNGGERGLLSIAFDADFANFPFVYLYYDFDPPGAATQALRISRIPVDPLTMVPDPTAEQILLTIDQPFTNHNGGLLRFGPDGYLYAGIGDGGSQDDPGNRSQDLSNYHGKILRLDPHNFPASIIPPDNPFAGVPGALGEIWALGFRNPWRWSFNEVTGELFVADVGGARREEIDIVERGLNYGWRLMEGTLCNVPSTNCDPTNMLVRPVFEYDHSAGNRSITGGHHYFGAAIPELTGVYIFGDYMSGRIWRLDVQGGTFVSTLLIDTALSISSFGLDAAGELYILHHAGEVHRLDVQRL